MSDATFFGFIALYAAITLYSLVRFLSLPQKARVVIDLQREKD